MYRDPIEIFAKATKALGGKGASVIFVLLTLFFFRCSFKKPVAPSWDVKLTIPLTNEVFTMAELIEDEESLQADSTGLLTFSLEKEIDRFEVGDNLKIDALSDSLEATLGKITIAEPGSKSIDVKLAAIYPEASDYDGLEVVIPPFSFPSLRLYLPQFTNFFSITLESGGADITIVNNLAIPLGSPIEVLLKRTDTEAVIGAVIFPEEIAPGDSSRQTLDLSGKTIPNTLLLEVSGSSPGSGGEPVIVDSQSSFTVKVVFSTIVITEATAQIPAQEFFGSDSVVVEDSISVSEAIIKSGSIHFKVTSFLPLDINLQLELPDLTSPTGKALTVEIPMSNYGTSNRDILLDGYVFKPQALVGGKQSISFNWQVQTPGTGDDFATVKSEDYVRAEVEISKLIFSMVKGRLNSVKVNIDPVIKEIDFPSDLHNISFPSARMELIIKNGINFPLQSNLLIVGRNNGSGNTVDLQVQSRIEASDGDGQPIESTIVLDGNNSNIVEFLRAMPEEIEVSGEIAVGDGNVEGTIFDSDFVEGTVKIEAPLELIFSQQEINTDVDTVEINEDTRDKIRENIESGRIIAELENHLPIGAQVEIYVALIDSLVFSAPNLVIGPITVNPGLVNPQSGRVYQSASDNVIIDLDKDQLSVFENSPVYTGLSITIPGTNGQKIGIYDADFLGMKAYSVIKYRLQE